MRVVVIGGTEFIGRRLVETLVERGDDVLVVHRGRTEPADALRYAHLHVDRRDFATVAGEVAAFGPDAVVDTCADRAQDVQAVLPHLPDAHLVVLSSMDVYRVYELMLADDHTPTPVPFDEDAPLRESRYPYRGKGMDLDDYDKLHVEPAYLERGGTVLRLGMVHGPRDPQRREDFVLRRLRAGRARIPIGPARTLTTRLHVDDAARAVVAALDRPSVAAGEVFNIGEAVTYSVRGWIEAIMSAAGRTTKKLDDPGIVDPGGVELVRVPDHVLPADLRVTRAHSQHLLANSHKAMTLLGWRPEAPATSVARSVRWHLEHGPTEGPMAGPTDFSADDEALSHAG